MRSTAARKPDFSTSRLRTTQVALAGALVLGCLSLLSSGQVASAQDFLNFPPMLPVDFVPLAPVVNIAPIYLKITLTIETCDLPNAQTNDPITLTAHVSDSSTPRSWTLGSFAQEADHVYTFHSGYENPFPDPDTLDALTLTKRGTDALCIARMALADPQHVFWSWSPSSAAAASYKGLHSSTGPIWIDDEPSDAPANMVRFSDISWRMASGAIHRPVTVTFHTCPTSANMTHPQTDDSVKLTWIHDGLYESLWLNNPGNDREANNTDTYIVDRLGMRDIESLVVSKTGTNGWCYDRIVVAGPGGRTFLDRSQVVVMDTTTSSTTSNRKAYSASELSSIGSTSTSDPWSYAFLPLQRSSSWTYLMGGSGEVCRPSCGGLFLDLSCDRCDQGFACRSNKCVPAGGQDQPCNEGNVYETNYSTCDSPFSCLQGVCKIDTGLGASCTTDSQCDTGLVCTSNRCSVPTSFQGRSNCPYGSPDCNRCVYNVESRFNTWNDSYDTRQAFDAREGDQLPPENYTVYNYSTNLTGRYMSHLQGFQRIPLGDSGFGTWYAHTRSTPTEINSGLMLAYVSTTGSAESKYLYHIADTDHAGGLQVMGRYVAVASECSDADRCKGDSYVDIFDVENLPMGGTDPVYHVSRLDEERLAFASLVQLRDHRYLMFVGGPRSESGRFYVTKDDSISGDDAFTKFQDWDQIETWVDGKPPSSFDWICPAGLPVGGTTGCAAQPGTTRCDELPKGATCRKVIEKANGWDGFYQNMNFVTECGTNNLYLLGMGTNNRAVDEVQRYHLYRVMSRKVDGKLRIDLERRAWHEPEAHDCTLRAGGSVHVTSDGGMTLYCASKLTTSNGNLTFSTYDHVQ